MQRRSFKLLLFSFLLLLAFRLNLPAQSDIWQKAYADFHFNFCEESSFALAGGYKFNRFAGLGLHTSGSGGLGNRYHISALGVALNAYANVFYYNVFAAPVLNFEFVDDYEFPGREFKKEKSTAAFFQIQGGVRLFRLLTVGGSFHVSTPIKGLYTEYTDRFDPMPTIALEEIRKSGYYGYNFFVGFTF